MPADFVFPCRNAVFTQWTYETQLYTAAEKCDAWELQSWVKEAKGGDCVYRNPQSLSASEVFRKWPSPRTPEHERECVIQDFCGMRLMFEGQSGEFCIKLLRSSQKRAEEWLSPGQEKGNLAPDLIGCNSSPTLGWICLLQRKTMSLGVMTEWGRSFVLESMCF